MSVQLVCGVPAQNMHKFHWFLFAFILIAVTALAARVAADDGQVVATQLSYTADQSYTVTLTCTRKTTKTLLFWIRLMTGGEIPHGNDKCYWTVDALRGSSVTLFSRAETIDFLSRIQPVGTVVTDLLTGTPVQLLEEYGDSAFKRAFNGAVVVSAAKARANILD